MQHARRPRGVRLGYVLFKLPLRLLLLACSHGVAAAAAAGSTYYVDASLGSDRNLGIAADAAWKTIAKVNASSFAPGDQILLKRGEVWNEQLTVTSSGAPGKPIVFGAYGSGDAPLIRGVDTITGWRHVTGATDAKSADTVAEGRYRVSLARRPRTVYVNGFDAPLAEKTSLGALSANPGAFYYDSAAKYLYVRLKNLSDPSGHTILASQRDYGVYGADKSHITIADLAIEGSAVGGIKVENSSGDVGSENWSITGNRIEHVGEYGIWVSPRARESASVLKGITVKKNTIGTVDAAPQLNYDSGGILLRATSGAVVQANTVATVNRYGLRVSDHWNVPLSDSPFIADNEFGMNYSNIGVWNTPDAVVTRNRVRNSSGGGILVGGNGDGGRYSTGAKLTYNIIDDVTISAGGELYNGIDINAGSTNGKAFNNVIRRVAASSLTLEGDGGASDGWEIANNIFDCSENYQAFDSAGACIYIAASVTQYSFRNNLFYTCAANKPRQFQSPGGVYMGYAAFHALAGDTGSIVNANPLFADVEGSSLALRAASPAIDAGANLGADYRLGLASDASWPAKMRTLDQNAYGNAWDIGAFVFAGSAALDRNQDAKRPAENC